MDPNTTLTVVDGAREAPWELDSMERAGPHGLGVSRMVKWF